MTVAEPCKSTFPDTGGARGGGSSGGSGGDREVPARFVAALTAAYFGTWLALLPVLTVTLALRVEEISPDDKSRVLSLVLAVGAAVALVSQNLFGALSDRTTSRFGMRRPWIAAGALLGVASLGLLATASTVPTLLTAWALTQLMFNVLLAALNPVLADQVPAAQLGRVSGIVGITTTLAAASGAGLANLLMPNLRMAILIPGAVCLVAVAVLLAVLPDRHLAPADRAPLTLRALAGSFWLDPRTAPDFAWAWVSRFLVAGGGFTLTHYLPYFLISRFGYTDDNVGTPVFQTLLITSGMAIVSSVVCGNLSDRIGRRKPFVLLSAVVAAAALLAAARVESLPLFLVAAGCYGLANGCYIAVDLALVTQVLPSHADTAKDLGVFHIAHALPQALVPAAAPLFLSIGDGGENYTAFLTAGAVSGLVGAVLVLRVRGVR